MNFNSITDNWQLQLDFCLFASALNIVFHPSIFLLKHPLSFKMTLPASPALLFSPASLKISISIWKKDMILKTKLTWA